MPRHPSSTAHVAIRFLLLSGVALPLGPLRAETPTSCVAVRVPTDSQDVTCTLDRSMTGRALRYVAEFQGSHDDTRLALVATLDGAPLTCAAGSTTSLFAEDGIVHLDCRFRADAKDAAAAPVLRVALTVHHAQYVSSSLTAE